MTSAIAVLLASTLVLGPIPRAQTVSITPVDVTVTSTGSRILTLTEKDLYKLAETARAKAVRYRIERDQCREELALALAEVATLRAEIVSTATTAAAPSSAPLDWALLLGVGSGGIAVGLVLGALLAR